jgi:hypothetical protein
MREGWGHGALCNLEGVYQLFWAQFLAISRNIKGSFRKFYSMGGAMAPARACWLCPCSLLKRVRSHTPRPLLHLQSIEAPTLRTPSSLSRPPPLLPVSHFRARPTRGASSFWRRWCGSELTVTSNLPFCGASLWGMARA